MNERGVERRLAAILAADVVGYSRLMEQNEDGTVVRLGRHRKELVEPLVATHRGRVVKLMGDGMLCEFGSVVDALHCAMRIQEEMAEREKDTPPGERIRLRIGINTGDVIVEDGDIYGSGVNVASRLEQLCEPGGVLVSGTVYDQLYGRSDVALDFVGEQQVKNIDRPVRIYRAHTTDSGPASAETKLAPASEPPSLAVLPFIVLGGGPKWERLAKGISGDIVTDLARHHEDVFVLGSNSSFAYKNCAGDIRQVGRELGVRYVLEGSLQAGGRMVRITARLEDTVTGAQVWAARYERPQGEVFAIQDEVTEQVVNGIGGWGGQLARAGRSVARRKPPASLEAYDLYLLGIEQKHRFSREAVAEAIRLFSLALDKDPRFARAWASLGLTYAISAMNGFADDPAEMKKRWRACFQTALELDPSDPKARTCTGDLRAQEGDLIGAVEEYRRALAVSSGDADVLALLAVSFALAAGDPGEGLELAHRAIRLNPNTPSWYFSSLGRAAYVQGEYRQSIAALTQAPRDIPSTLLFLALAHAQLGEMDVVRNVLGQLATGFPSFTVEDFIRGFPVTNPLARDAIKIGATRAGLSFGVDV